jgi:hypothetical protein
VGREEMTMLYLEVDEFYPVYVSVGKEDYCTFAVDVPDDFILRFKLMHKQFWEMQHYIEDVRDGKVLTA